MIGQFQKTWKGYFIHGIVSPTSLGEQNIEGMGQGNVQEEQKGET